MALALLVACGAAILYIIAGYPLLVALVARFRSQPVHKAAVQKSVTAIVAVYNGGHYLAPKLESLLALDYPAELLEIIVASDGSTDDTNEIAERFGTRGVRLMRLPRGGKCAALNAAIREARGEILLLTDVRQLLDPQSLRYLIENYADRRVGAVSGEMIITAPDGRAEVDIGAYWRFECWLRDSLARIDSMLGATGPFYTLRRDLAVTIPEHILLDDMYLPLKGAFFRGYRLVMERRARSFDPPMPLDVEFRRKVRTLAGNYQLLRELPELLSSRNRMWIHYVSYKLGRLLLPWLLLAFFVLSIAIGPPWRGWLLAAQGCAYALALVDPLISAGFPLKRLSSPAHSFLVMMWAAVLALKVFFAKPQDLWKVTSARRT
jgi:glycosyltransferase involved in cell wall biosynthesis